MVRPTADEIDWAISSPTAWAKFKEIAKDASLAELSFDGLSLSDIDFSGLDLERCTFTSSRIVRCDFSRSNLYEASFRDAHIESSSFAGSILSYGDISESEIIRCDFAAAEVTGALFSEASFVNCELSRCRGISQFTIDQAVGDSETSIPQFLDYPEHWLATEEEREEAGWVRRLSAFRGDDLLFCTFDGRRLATLDVPNVERKEVKEALEHLQTKVRNAVKENLFHNECPQIFRALVDYYEAITTPAGNDRDRWPRKLGELEEIKVGLEGNCLIAQVTSSRSDIEQSFPHKVAQIDHIVATHMLMAAGLTRWRSFLQGAVEANLAETDIAKINDTAVPISEFLESLPDQVDAEIPETIRVLRRLREKPKEVAKLGAYGIVRCVESIFSSIFVFVRRLLQRLADEAADKVPRATVRLLITGLTASGVYGIFASFPHLSTWLSGGVAALKGLGIVP